MLFLSLSSSLSFTFNYPILKIWYLHLPVYWHLKLNVANIELFFPQKSLSVPSVLFIQSQNMPSPCTLQRIGHFTDPSSSYSHISLIKSCGFISEIHPESIYFSSSPWKLPLPRKSSLNGHDHPKGRLPSTLDSLPTAARMNFVRCASYNITLLLKAVVTSHHT